MATTAEELVTGAYSLLGVLASGETLSAEDANTGLTLLNNMLDSWNTERLNIYSVQDHTATLSGQTLTIGPGEDIDVDRPIRLDERCFTRLNNIDYSMRVVNGNQYASLVLKTLTSSYPFYVFYDADAPTGTLYFWPQPPSPVEVHIRLWKQLPQFTSISDTADLPQGYRRAIIFSLAEELAPQFRNLDQNIVRIAAKARRNIKRANLQDNMLNMPSPLVSRGRRFNIYTGE